MGKVVADRLHHARAAPDDHRSGRAPRVHGPQRDDLLRRDAEARARAPPPSRLRHLLTDRYSLVLYVRVRTQCSRAARRVCIHRKSCRRCCTISNTTIAATPNSRAQSKWRRASAGFVRSRRRIRNLPIHYPTLNVMHYFNHEARRRVLSVERLPDRVGQKRFGLWRRDRTGYLEIESARRDRRVGRHVAQILGLRSIFSIARRRRPTTSRQPPIACTTNESWNGSAAGGTTPCSPPPTTTARIARPRAASRITS